MRSSGLEGYRDVEFVRFQRRKLTRNGAMVMFIVNMKKNNETVEKIRTFRRGKREIFRSSTQVSEQEPIISGRHCHFVNQHCMIPM